MKITDETISRVKQCIGDGDWESAIELIFSECPLITRDEAVDEVERIEKEMRI